MNHDSQHPTVGERYAAALDAHYSARDLPAAMGLYEQILLSDPKSQEAGYSRSQIVNIVRAVVPQDDLLAMHKELVRSHFATGGFQTPADGAAVSRDQTSPTRPADPTE